MAASTKRIEEEVKEKGLLFAKDVAKTQKCGVPKWPEKHKRFEFHLRMSRESGYARRGQGTSEADSGWRTRKLNKHSHRGRIWRKQLRRSELLWPSHLSVEERHRRGIFTREELAERGMAPAQPCA